LGETIVVFLDVDIEIDVGADVDVNVDFERSHQTETGSILRMNRTKLDLGLRHCERILSFTGAKMVGEFICEEGP
jgi:hypothetical protein